MRSPTATGPASEPMLPGFETLFTAPNPDYPDYEARMRLPKVLAGFVDSRGPLTAYEADVVRNVLRIVFAPALP